jgi:hypothetical protein
MLKNYLTIVFVNVANNLKFGFQSCLSAKRDLAEGGFTQFISCYTIKNAMTLDRNNFLIVGVYEMIAPFTEKIITVFLNIFYEIAPFNRHCLYQQLTVQKVQRLQVVLILFVCRQESFREEHLLMIHGNFRKFFLRLQFQAIQLIVTCNRMKFLCIWQCSV